MAVQCLLNCKSFFYFAWYSVCDEACQFQMHEPHTTHTLNMDLSGLSNDELVRRLRSHGVNPGPIVGEFSWIAEYFWYLFAQCT